MKRHKHALWGIVLLCVAITLGACRPDKKKQQGSASAIPDTTLDIRYASGFWLEAKEGYRLLHIKDPQKTNAAEYTFALRERGTRPILPKGVTVIDLPIQRFICMTSLQLSSCHGEGGRYQQHPFPCQRSDEPAIKGGHHPQNWH